MKRKNEITGCNYLIILLNFHFLKNLPIIGKTPLCWS